MWDLCRLLGRALVGLFRSRAALEAENLVLRQQVNVLRRTTPRKPVFSSIDRLIFVGLYRLFPIVREALAIIKPETVVRWHRVGFRTYWRWRARISRETVVPIGLAFQIAFKAVCISPKTPEAVITKVVIPIIVATIPDDLLAALATAVCRTSAVCWPMRPLNCAVIAF
jgi:hypothetical protein